MKTGKMKAILLAGTVGFIAAVGGNVYGQTYASASSFKQEKSSINKNLASVSLQQERLKSLRKQCKDEHTAGIKNTNTHAEIIRAKADLQKSKEYVRADKAQLMMKHDAVIAERQKTIREQQTAALKAKRQLRNDLAHNNSEAVLQAQIVLDKREALKQNETALKLEKRSRNLDLIAVNNEMAKAKAQPALFLSAQSTLAKTQNLAMK